MNIKNTFLKPGKLTQTFIKVDFPILIYNRSKLFLFQNNDLSGSAVFVDVYLQKIDTGLNV